MHKRTRAAIAMMTAAATLALAACSSSTPGGGSSSSPATAAGSTTTVGFIMVGSTDDAGYNEAVSDGAKAVEKDLGTSVKVITADQIPENDSVTQTMQAMVSQGAKIIFATSYGYFKYALAFAKAHPDVTVLHQGGFLDGTFPANFGTYWGQAYDPVGLGGMAAGGVTQTNKLGFIYAFPIAQTIANIDAFELGAQKLNPAAQTYVVNTSSWCDPLKQKQAVTALLDQGVDVFSQHQDCQSTVIQAVKSAGKKIVGYHYDAAALYPDGWLTGSAWNWAPIYEKIIGAVQAGTFTGGIYNANWTGSFATGDNPLELASFGTSVSADLQAKIKAEQAALTKAGSSIFTGPIYCQDGTVLVAAGKVATYADTNSFSCLVKGVVGTLPSN
ncbi:BMP family ABC transporter substrate-binding protein [Gryllotalpicola sp.]|uniref:BMP family ABC transporter substrate-binding protein n=1 Tax=Gryllotalpicola sp. TaxID=1932787 RepID=UPI00260D14C3|nr:BMP family ABC transporter substrate-binding protein [Gryllotalpicola sp.]